MGWAWRTRLLVGTALAGAVCAPAAAQVFTVGEASATADVNTDFKATHVELPEGRMDERGRRELIRDLEAEQGFAHRELPVATNLTLVANGNLTPGAAGYKKLIYEKGEFAKIGDRVSVTAIEVKGDKLLIDLNGGPYAKHRFLRHIQIGVGGPMGGQTMGGSLNDGQEATGCRVTLVFEGGVPEVSAPQVKALLYPLVDFGVKSGPEAYADTLPGPVKKAIAVHQVLVGMNREMVIAAMGAPESKVRERDADGPYEEWIYGHQPQTMRFVRFHGDRVSMVKVAALGKAIEVHDQDELAGYLPPKPGRTITEGDAQGDDTKRGAPTLKAAGETLPDAQEAGSQNGKVQYPVEKPKSKASTGGNAPASGTTAPASAPAAGSVPATPEPQNYAPASQGGDLTRDRYRGSSLRSE
jgi:hypothetical protein